MDPRLSLYGKPQCGSNAALLGVSIIPPTHHVEDRGGKAGPNSIPRRGSRAGCCPPTTTHRCGEGGKLPLNEPPKSFIRSRIVRRRDCKTGVQWPRSARVKTSQYAGTNCDEQCLDPRVLGPSRRIALAVPKQCFAHGFFDAPNSQATSFARRATGCQHPLEDLVRWSQDEELGAASRDSQTGRETIELNFLCLVLSTGDQQHVWSVQGWLSVILVSSPTK